MLKTIQDLPESDRILFVDFEGIDLSRTGVLCCGQLLCKNSNLIFILDNIAFPGIYNHTIMKTAADAAEFQAFSLKTCFDSEQYRQVLFDPRSDADALYAQHGVYLRNAICLQLSEVAKDRSDGKYRALVNGLARVLGTCLPTYEQRQYATKVKESGRRLFAPECGGSYEVFRNRPIDRRMIDYMCLDIVHFQYLYEKLFMSLSTKWTAWVIKHSIARVDECKAPRAAKKGRHRAVAPQ
jgi:exonuclease 3'-5' domain-containing protein 1